MFELFAFAGPMLVLAAIACGWMADAFSPSHGYGFLIDMGLGLVGAVAVAAALHAVSWSGSVGLLVTFAVGLTGGIMAIVAQRTFWRATLAT